MGLSPCRFFVEPQMNPARPSAGAKYAGALRRREHHRETQRLCASVRGLMLFATSTYITLPSLSGKKFQLLRLSSTDQSLLDNDLHGIDTAAPCHSRAEPALDPIGSGNPGHNRNTTDGRPTTAAGRFGGKYAEFSETYVLGLTAAIHLPGREQATWPILEAGRSKRQTVQLNSTKSLCRRQCLRGQ